jgi:hypothetical protein
MRFSGLKTQKINFDDGKRNGMSCFLEEIRSGFLRCAAHKNVSSFGRNDGSFGFGDVPDVGGAVRIAEEGEEG